MTNKKEDFPDLIAPSSALHILVEYFESHPELRRFNADLETADVKEIDVFLANCCLELLRYVKTLEKEYETKTKTC